MKLKVLYVLVLMLFLSNTHFAGDIVAVIQKNNAKLYESTKKGSKVIKVLKKKDEVTLVKKENDKWLNVKYNNKSLYIKSEFVKKYNKIILKKTFKEKTPDHILSKGFTYDEALGLSIKGFAEKDDIAIKSKGFNLKKNEIQTEQDMETIEELDESNILFLCQAEVEKLNLTTEVIKDKEILKWSETVLDKIKSITGTDIDLNLYIIKSDDVNAFAMPTGDIYVYSALIDLLKKHSDGTKKFTREVQGKLLSIIGHEVAHVLNRHSLNAISYQKAYEKLKGSKVHSKLSKIRNAIELAHSRADEYNADLYGAIFLHALGYKQEYAIKAMEDLQAAFGGFKTVADEIKSDHPNTNNRIKELRKQAKKIIKAYRYFQEGTSHMQGKRYDEAIRAYRGFLTILKNKSGFGQYNIGLAYLLRSIQDVPEAVVLDEDLFFEINELGPRGGGRGTSIYYPHNSKDYKKAVRHFNLAKRYSFNLEINPRVLAALATFNYRIVKPAVAKKKHYKKALLFAQSAVKLNPRSPIYHNVLANVYFLRKEYKKALIHYSKSLYRNGMNIKTYYNIATTYLTMKNKKRFNFWLKHIKSKQYFVNRLKKYFPKKLTKLKTSKTQKLADYNLKVKRGQNKKQVIAALGKPIVTKSSENLTLLLYKDTLVLLTAGEVTTIQITGKSITKTKKGLKLGSSMKDVRKKYGLPDRIVQKMDGSSEWKYHDYKVSFNIIQARVTAMYIYS